MIINIHQCKIFSFFLPWDRQSYIQIIIIIIIISFIIKNYRITWFGHTHHIFCDLYYSLNSSIYSIYIMLYYVEIHRVKCKTIFFCKKKKGQGTQLFSMKTFGYICD